MSTASQLNTREFLRWMWRQLTSMRTALILLLLLAVAAVPGSLFPQRSSAPAAVTDYLANNPTLGPILDKLQMFNVFSSVWFSSIYLLLFISLIGCIIPRIKAHWKSWRTPPPRTPANLNRLPQYRVIDLTENADSKKILSETQEILKKNRYRTELRSDSVAAERGMLKEAGNIAFHLSLIGVLIGVAVGSLFGYTGQKAVVEGETFVNNLSSYDSFTPGSYFKQDKLQPYSIRLNKFTVKYDLESQNHIGQPLDFTADVTTQEGPGAPEKKQTIKVNEPLKIGGTNVYLVGNGYAPHITVRDGQGNIAYSQNTISLATDANNTSTTVVKVPDAKPDQLAFVGFLLPTTERSTDNISFSNFPDLLNPTLTLDSYTGDLGLDSGTPQNVFVLDTDKLKQLNGRKLPAGGIVLKPGQTYQLPEGKGSITLDAIPRYVGFDVHHDPGQLPVLIFSFIGLGTLAMSLFIPRRRAWAKIKEGKLELGLLARGEDFTLEREANTLEEQLRNRFAN
ncbi:MAG: cytochrome c biogenesis protein ResB [Micrococcaceae bacterium]